MTTLPEKQFKAINLIEDLLKQLKKDLGQTNKEKHEYNKTYKQDDKEKRKNFFQRFQFTSIRPQKRPQCHTEHKTQVFSGRNLITATSNFIHHYQLTNNNEHIDINKKNNNKTNPHHTPSHPHCSNEKNRKDSFFTRHGNSDDRIRATKVHSFIPSHLTNTPPPSSSSPYHTLHVTFISPPSFYLLHLTTILSPPPSHHHPFTPPPPTIQLSSLLLTLGLVNSLHHKHPYPPILDYPSTFYQVFISPSAVFHIQHSIYLYHKLASKLRS